MVVVLRVLLPVFVGRPARPRAERCTEPPVGRSSALGPRVSACEEWNRALHGLGDQVLKEAASFVESRRPTVETSRLLAEGEPAWVLHEEARSASLVVVGSWHLSKRRGMFSSASVALPLTAHASCPVVVVPEPEHIAQQPAYVVVGVDGSEHAAAAVDVAFEEAALRGALLRALYVWHPPLLGVLDEDAAVRECRRVLSETVAGRTAAHPDVELRHEVVRGPPVQVLTEALRLSKAGIDVIETVITPRSSDPPPAGTPGRPPLRRGRGRSVRRAPQ